MPASQEEHQQNIIKYREYYNKELSDIGWVMGISHS